MFPGSKTTFLDIYGEIAVDFDFGFPEISSEKTGLEDFQDLKIVKKEKGKVDLIKTYDFQFCSRIFFRIINRGGKTNLKKSVNSFTQNFPRCFNMLYKKIKLL